MSSSSTLGRVAVGVALVGVIGALAFIMLGSSTYTYKFHFLNAGQLVTGNVVRVAGDEVGKVEELKVTPTGQAEVTISVDEPYAPLRQGTRGIIRFQSITGIAYRYVDLQVPEGDNPVIPDGGVVSVDQTTTQVDVDQIFNTLDPVARVAVQEFFKGQARQFRGRGDEANEALRYLNPALATSSRLFNELNRDTPLLAEFLQETDRLTTAVASRRDDLTEVIGRFNVTTRALGNKRVELQDALERFPDFMRLANTTFVNLRGTLDEVDPLVDATKPVARRLPAFFDELRPLTRDARPTLRDLRAIVRRPGRDNDLVELGRTLPPLARVALDPVERNGERRLGAFPEVSKGLKDSTENAAHLKQFQQDFSGWQDDFSHPGGYDANGLFAASTIYFNPFTSQGIDQEEIREVFTEIRALNQQIANLETQLGIDPGAVVPGGLPAPLDDVGTALRQLRERRQDLLNDTFVDLEDRLGNLDTRQNQFKRCPGASEERAPDGSNEFSEAEQDFLGCEENDRAVGEF